ncbi:Uncharacterised protein [Proteus mirabilis]|uniref:Uncharacterized protein n=1 Tax=Proteus mirabilis TaxID=584 RepID=A0A379FIQ3_PROMI|nr:Uncharacterised protein [Proteus mirabilis]
MISSSGIINAEGVLTLDSGINNQKLTVLGNSQSPALSCQLPDVLSPGKDVQFFPSYSLFTNRRYVMRYYHYILGTVMLAMSAVVNSATINLTAKIHPRNK